MIKLFNKYKEGSNLTILNTIYHKPYKMENGKWTNGAITLVAKDLDKDKKVISTIENPKYEYYVCKEEYWDELEDYYHSSFPKDKLELRECAYKEVGKDVAEYLGRLNEFYDNLRNGQRKLNNIMHIDNRIFRSCMNISDFYRYKFGQTYQNNPYPLHKGYLDIETDAYLSLSDFPDLGEVPINCVTFIDHWNKQSYTLMLEDTKNPQFYEMVNLYEKNPEHIDQLIWDNIIKAFGGESLKIEKYNLTGMKFNLLFYPADQELEMIRDLFKIINKSGIDFLLCWNMAFDIPYIIERIKVLGGSPKDIICHPAFKYKECEYTIDMKNRDEFHLRADKATISAPWVAIDQLLQFCGRRKSKITSFPGFKLDIIAGLVAGIHKLSYAHITHNIKFLPRLNWLIFVIYNIVDVIDQICIEEGERDIDYIFNMALETNTRYSKIHKPSITTYNEAIKIYENVLGLICGNNKNAILETRKEKYDGAYVSEPRMLGDFAKRTINGTPIMVCDNVADEDFTAMYPSEERNFNMSDETQIGKISIPDQIREGDDHLHKKVVAITDYGKNKDKDYVPPKYDRGGAYIEDLSAHNWLVFGNRWLGLPNYKELMAYVMKYYTEIRETDAVILDFDNQIMEKHPKYKKIPWGIKTECIYPEEQFINRERQPFYIAIPVEKSLKERLMNDFNSLRAF